MYVDLRSCCLRMGQRHNIPCAPLNTISGELISWADELRYLGVIVLRSRVFKCSLSLAKKLFYRSANAIFGEIGRIASEKVVLQLIISKCIPVILYGLEACPLTKSDLQSMDFVINRFLMKLFKINNIDHVTYCQHCFSFDMPSELWQKRVKAFESKFSEMYIGLPYIVKLFSFCLLLYLFIVYLFFCIIAIIIGEIKIYNKNSCALYRMALFPVP